MRVLEIKEICGENFNPIFINALRKYWKSTKSFQCIGNPKRQNLLLYLDGCKITYTDKSGNVCVASSGDVVYTPVGSEYRANMSDFASETSHTVGINFLLFDEFGEELVLSDKIQIFRASDTAVISSLFERAAIDDKGQIALSTRIILLEILSALASDTDNRDNSIVSKTIDYLSKNIENNPSISDLAKQCNVSEVHLRRKFREKMGTSPAKYRENLRLCRAIMYLKFGDISIQEISDTLGYSTVSHFIKSFKQHYGSSPLHYRKCELEK